MSLTETQYQKMIFAKNLNFYLNAKGLSQADIVAKFNITASTVSDWCNAKKYPRVDKIQLLADYFGILKSDLTEEKSPHKLLVDNYIQRYEALSTIGQQKVDAYIDDLLDNPKYRKKAVVPQVKSTCSSDTMEIAALGGIDNPQPQKEKFEIL